MAAISAGFISRSTQAAGPVIQNAQILTPELARFDRFELRFDMKTAATHPDLPFDAAPPKGLEQVSGVSADAIFYSPSGRVWVQPAFRYQPYRLTTPGNRDHFLPAGKVHWQVRFSPQEAGEWEVRLRVRDAGGTTFYPSATGLPFQVMGESINPTKRHGFLRVATADRRYFEFSDGTAFHGAGFNAGFHSAAEADRRLKEYGINRVTLVRAWLSGAGINASHWSPWASHHLPANGYLPGVSYATEEVFPGHDLAYKLDGDNPCLFQGWQQGAVAVEGGTTYSVRVTAKVKGNGTFVVKTGGWLDKVCARSGNGRANTPPLKASSKWEEVTGTIQTTAGQVWLNPLYLVLEGDGTALIDEVALFRSDDPEETNLLQHGEADAHLHFDSLLAARWDVIIEAAENAGVYLKLVSDEKNEWIRNHMDADGLWSADGDNQNFYSKPGTKARWLQEAWWRYIIARWGYSTAIHSFEYVNEGDPYNGNHYEAAAAMAAFFDRNDPAGHMVTTSFWHSFPNREFWSNPRYAAIDYADIHAYITTGWGAKNASFLGDLRVDEIIQYQGAWAVKLDASNTGSYPITTRGVTLRESGEWQVRFWMRAETLHTDCRNKQGVWVRWSLSDGRSGASGSCSVGAETFEWKNFHTETVKGRLTTEDLVVKEGEPVELRLSIENDGIQQGAAWISRVELISPTGVVTPVIGAFDSTPFIQDPAWYSAAYGLLWGGASPVGSGKPLIRGESGIDIEGQNRHPDLNKDRDGVWLHDLVWAHIAPGGMIDLPWWAGDTITENQRTGRIPGLLSVYKGYAQFMEDIPLNNGRYRDAAASGSDPNLRAWGQIDREGNRAHLWLQNTAFGWQDAVKGKTPIPIIGSVTITGVRDGVYRVDWWDTWNHGDPVFKTETATARQGYLTLTLPAPLTRDAAVKIYPAAP